MGSAPTHGTGSGREETRSSPAGASSDGLAVTPRVPRYYEVKQQLRHRIDGLPPGTALPAERVLSDEFRTSRSTVRQALLELAVEGRIVRHQGRGTFVAPPKDVLPLQLRSFSDEWRARGRTPSSTLLDQRVEPAEEEVATALEIEPGAPVFRFERLRAADRTPLALEVVYLSVTRFAGLDDAMDGQVSLYELLRERWGVAPAEAQQTIETVPASPQVAGLLQTEAGTPMLLLTRVTRDEEGRVFEFVRSLYRGDRYRFVTSLLPPSE
jgi:GntR family transcriptional regulator